MDAKFRRRVVEATRAEPGMSNSWNVRLRCGHFILVMGRGGKAPFKVICLICRATCVCETDGAGVCTAHRDVL